MPIDFRPVASCIELSIKGQENVLQSLMYNVLHIQTAATVPSPSEIDTALNTVFIWANTVYKQNFSNQIHIVEFRARSLAAQVAPFGFTTSDIAGTQGDYDELEHAPLILLHGPMTDRHMAGRFYAFPPGYGSVSQLGYDSTHMNNLLNAFANLRAALGSAGLQLAVASKDTVQCYRVTSVGRTNRKTVQKRRRASFGR